ncbi:MAG: hypothetical protein JO154_10780 [Chitinophaga sp.]|uniref:nuclear transport factor 2 family protein n=1 Tax=Chitinophaga sp. TaxID=1869181 RepID=UPI0025C6BFFB|nr:hypothetical protein [Chitinophaga sp.]MBV8253081.1 hypothetical protein [Chitinophaga sp.]
MEHTPKQMVIDLLKSIETGATAPVSYINPDKYIQHNLDAADGLAGFGALMQDLPKGSAKVNTLRVFQDGDIVFAHTDYNFFGPKIGFDIFRFEDNYICEHWDNLQTTPKIPNPSGHSMTDGSTDLHDLGKTSANKKLVQNFVEEVLINGHLEYLPKYFYDDKYIQHNPGIGDGLSGFNSALKDWAEHGVTMKYTKVHQVLGEGNFVLVVSEGDMDSCHSAFYDLFRVEDDFITEHWDTVQCIPAKNQWKNKNGKF